MINLEYSERYLFIGRYPYSYSTRFIKLARYHTSERVATFNAAITKDSFRKAYMCTESPYCTRYIFMAACRLKEYTSRVCALAVIANSAERTCYFKVDGKIILHSATVFLAFTYASDRSTWVHKDPITQRAVMFPLLLPSERNTFIQRQHKLHVGTPKTFSSFTYQSERSVAIQLHQNYDQRSVSYILGLYSDRATLSQTAHSIILHSPTTVSTISNYYSERSVSLKCEITYSDRSILLGLVPFSERYVHTKLRLTSDRFVSLLLYASYYVHSSIVQQAWPKSTERKCMFNAILNYSDRYVFLETRELYVSKKPFIMGDSQVLSSYLDTYSNMTINSDRTMNVDGSSIVVKEFLNKADSSRVVISASSSEYTVSIVDYTGARISLNVDSIKKKLLSANTFALEITIQE